MNESGAAGVCCLLEVEPCLSPAPPSLGPKATVGGVGGVERKHLRARTHTRTGAHTHTLLKAQSDSPLTKCRTAELDEALNNDVCVPPSILDLEYLKLVFRTETSFVL